MITNEEIALNPTPFIQSTHNTIGSQIALLLTCQGYNQTYTQRAFSFENAMLDALLELRERPEQSLMVGGVDEITDTSHAILRRFGIFRSASTQSLSLFDGEADGTINGEGATYCILSGQQTQSAKVCIDSVATYYQPNILALTNGIGHFLESATLSIDDIDMVLLGKSGDRRQDKSVEFISSKLFNSNSIGRFKHLSGEYPTASGFAVHLAARIIKEKMIPQVVMERDRGREPNNILIYNTYFGSYHSLILLRNA
jgi:3-oxoacyl-(acyl-carrier-protein) synthase